MSQFSNTEEVSNEHYIRLAPAGGVRGGESGEDQKYAVVITASNKDRLVCTSSII